jgi:hypothetical protein
MAEGTNLNQLENKSVTVNLTRSMSYKDHIKNELFKKHLSVGFGKYIYFEIHQNL